MIQKIAPDLPAVALGLAFFVLIVLAKVALTSGFARRFLPQAPLLTAVSAAFNAATAPILLFPFLNPGLARSYDAIPLLAGPAFWVFEGVVYYSLAQLKPRPTVALVVALGLLQVVLLGAAVYARDAILIG